MTNYIIIDKIIIEIKSIFVNSKEKHLENLISLLEKWIGRNTICKSGNNLNKETIKEYLISNKKRRKISRKQKREGRNFLCK